MDLLIAIWKFFLAFVKGILSLWQYWAWIPLLMIILFVIKYLLKLLLAKIKSPKTKGKKGENKTSQSLKDLPHEKYFVLNDILLETEDGTAQIDHIVVSVYGIFVIETKNYQGIIYGSEKSYNWTQNIYGNKQSFKNPIHQNYGHIKTVEKALSSYGNLPIRSIVAFSEQAELHVETDETPVIHTQEIGTCIKVLSKTETITEMLAKEIYDTLLDCNITDKEARKNHIAEAKFKKYVAEEKSFMGICPRCGGKLVERNGRTGVFIGCSNYPKCRYTENIK